LIAASSPDFAAIGIFAALWSVGVGGNLPVDSAIFLEFLPATHQYLLTVLSVFWALAQVMATLIAWPLLGNLACQEDAKTCTRSENMGWRYFLVTIGGIWMILFVVRFMFPLYESPKYLMGRGRDEDAVAVVHEVARRNGTTSTLTIDELEVYNVAGEQGTTAADILHRRLEKINLTHVRALFATKMAFSTSVIIAVWAFIGLGFPLYNVRSSTFPSRTLIPTYPYSPPLPPTILLPTHQYKISIT
jgi:MFS family permease